MNQESPCRQSPTLAYHLLLLRRASSRHHIHRAKANGRYTPPQPRPYSITASDTQAVDSGGKAGRAASRVVLGIVAAAIGAIWFEPRAISVLMAARGPRRFDPARSILPIRALKRHPLPQHRPADAPPSPPVHVGSVRRLRHLDRPSIRIPRRPLAHQERITKRHDEPGRNGIPLLGAIGQIGFASVW